MHHQHNATPGAILALDLGTTTGWALSLQDHSVTHGYVRFKPQRFEGGGMRYLRFRRWLDEVQATALSSTGVSGLDVVYFEEVRRHLGVDAAHAYGGFLATLTSWCEHQKIPYQGVPVGTIKRHVTGKGNAGKSEMVLAMRARGYLVADDNEADALAVLVWALAQGNERSAGGARHG